MLIAVIFAIFLLALLLRLRAAVLLPEDVDEPLYLSVARDIAGFIRNFDIRSFITYAKNLEHPDFGKFLFALALLVRDNLLSARFISVVLGSLTVLLISFRTPVGGFFLATELLTIQYSSEVYLDTGAVFFVLVSIIMYEMSRKNKNWFYLSGIVGGLALATKYTSFLIFQIIPILILADNIKSWKVGIKKIFILAAIATGVFLVVNPPFWQDAKLIHSLSFHGEFAENVSRYINFPWWYHLSLIWNSEPAAMHAGVFLIDIEKIILVLGFLGFPLLLYRKRMMESLWFAFSLVFLAAWPVKWPWYTMIFTPALAMSGGFLIEDLARFGYRSIKKYSNRIRTVFSNVIRKIRGKLNFPTSNAVCFE